VAGGRAGEGGTRCTCRGETIMADPLPLPPTLRGRGCTGAAAFGGGGFAFGAAAGAAGVAFAGGRGAVRWRRSAAARAAVNVSSGKAP